MIAINRFVKEHIKATLIILVTLAGGASYAALSGKNLNFLNSFLNTSSQFDTCRTGLHYRNDVMNNVRNLLSENGGVAEEYFSAKGLSEEGLSYLLLVKYETNALMVTYRAVGGIKVKKLSRKEVTKLISGLIGADYDQTKDYFGGDSFHGTCNFMRLYNFGEQHEIKLINAPLTSKDKNEIAILSRINTLIGGEYLDDGGDFNVTQPPAELSETELEALNELTKGDLFHELRELKLKKL